MSSIISLPCASPCVLCSLLLLVAHLEHSKKYKDAHKHKDTHTHTRSGMDMGVHSMFLVAVWLVRPFAKMWPMWYEIINSSAYIVQLGLIVSPFLFFPHRKLVMSTLFYLSPLSRSWPCKSWAAVTRRWCPSFTPCWPPTCWSS